MRNNHLAHLDTKNPFDVVIIGAGVSGAPIYHALCKKGYSVALFDKGDFASGTSQASGMMVWGGLLYLKQMDFRTVRTMCHARDMLLNTLPLSIDSRQFRFLPAVGGETPWVVMMGLYLYWLLGDSARQFPAKESDFAERVLIKNGTVQTSLQFEEAFLKDSDSRYVQRWICPFDSEGTVPLNYCEITGGRFSSSEGRWHLDVRDTLSGTCHSTSAKMVINCAGVWADNVNAMLGITSEYRHVMSKGVYINLPKEETHDTPLVFEMGEHADVLTYVPWGPVAMWGPTETPLTDIERGLNPTKDDLRFLLKTVNRNLKRRVGAEDIVSVRCGIRPLAVDKDYSKSAYPLELSRKYAVSCDSDNRALTVYGGKLTTSAMLADTICGYLKELKPSREPAVSHSHDHQPDYHFPGIEIPQVSPEWARDHEFCCTLDDYLRRRTNISQWTPRMGLGRADERKKEIEVIAETFSGASGISASEQINRYSDRVKNTYDNLLNSI